MEPDVPEFQFKDFEYEPLPTPSSIRLLRLIRHREGGRAGPSLHGRPLIEVVMRTVDLADSPTYKAMSYTWGSPYIKGAPDEDSYSLEHRWPLAVNGRLLYIGKSIYEAISLFSPTSASNEDMVDQRYAPYNKTRLIQAAEDGNSDQVVDLLGRGADVHRHDMFGETALHYAAENGHLDVVKTLVSHGASCALTDSRGRTPLACCREQKRGQHDEVSRVLLHPHIYRSEAHMARQRYFPIGSDATFVNDFWVDSICINQNDLLERNAQVALMARIYTSANSVVIWLGPADEETKKVLMPLSEDQLHKENRATMQKADLERADSQKHTAWHLLAGRAWFQRKWVIQEFCLARQFEMYCGTLRVQPLLDRAGTFGITPRSRPLYQFLSLRLWYSGMLIQNEIRRQDQWDEMKSLHRLNSLPSWPGLGALIIQTWSAMSTDPRDAIFALLSLVDMAPAEKQGNSRQAAIRADYTKSLSQVFTEAARIFVEARDETWYAAGFQEALEPLEGLSWVQHQAHDQFTLIHDSRVIRWQAPTQIPDLPSWVPYFHQPLATKRLYQYGYCASGRDAGCSPTIWPSEDAAVLKISGCLFDTIAQMEGKGLLEEPGVAGYLPNLAVWFDMTSHLGGVYPYQCAADTDPASSTRLDVLWRSLVANDESVSAARAADLAGTHPFREFLCQCLWWGEKSREQCESDLYRLRELSTAEDEDLIPTIEEIEDSRASRQDAKWVTGRFNDALMAYYGNRALLRTDRGCLGLGPSRARPGDQVWLFAGARVPFLLRPVSTSAATGDGAQGRFQFLGECYVHGIMHGEAVESMGATFEPIEIQ